MRTRTHRSGAEFGPSDIHQDAAGKAEFNPRARKIFDHTGPNVGCVMRAVYPHAIHPPGKQVAHQRVVLSRVRRHRDHDPDPAIGRLGTKQSFGMLLEQGLTLIEARAQGLLGRRRGPPDNTVQQLQHRVERIQHMRFSSAQRGQAEFRQLLLQQSNVVTPQGEIVQQIGGTLAPRRMHAHEPLLSIRF